MGCLLAGMAERWVRVSVFLQALRPVERYVVRR